MVLFQSVIVMVASSALIAQILFLEILLSWHVDINIMRYRIIGLVLRRIYIVNKTFILCRCLFQGEIRVAFVVSLIFIIAAVVGKCIVNISVRFAIVAFAEILVTVRVGDTVLVAAYLLLLFLVNIVIVMVISFVYTIWSIARLFPVAISEFSVMEGFLW